MKKLIFRGFNGVTVLLITLTLINMQIGGPNFLERNANDVLAKTETFADQSTLPSSPNNPENLLAEDNDSNSRNQTPLTHTSKSLNLDNIIAMAGYNAIPGIANSSASNKPVAVMGIFLPLISENDVTTTIYVKNIDSTNAILDITYYDPNSNAVSSVGDSLPAHASRAYHKVPYAGFEGSAVITSNAELVSIVNIEKAGGSSFLSYNGQSFPDSQFILPKIMKNSSGWNSEIWIQNAGSSTANITIEFQPAVSGNAYTISDTISLYASKKYQLSGISNLGNSFSGWVSVVSDQPIAVVVVNTDSNSDKASAYNGVPTSSSVSLRTIFPLQQKNVNGLSTITSVVNPNSVDTAFNAYYINTNDSSTWVDSGTIQKGSELDLSTTANSNLPDGFDGFMILNSYNEPLVSINTIQNANLSTGDVYASVNDDPNGGTLMELPRVANIEAQGLVTQFSVQNLSTAGSANITMTYYDQSGATSAIVTDTLPIMGVKRYLTSDVSNLGQNWEGSVSVTSDQPVTGDVLQIVLAQPPANKTPVVIIPGLMGSRLFNPSDEIWPNVCRILASSFPSTDNAVLGLRYLALGPDGKSPPNGHENDPLYQINTKKGLSGLVDKIDGNCTSFNTPYGTIEFIKEDFYDLLVNHLINIWGYQVGKDLFIYPYDWRKDLAASADGLDSLIQEIKTQTGQPQVDIIAHSLGGLVAMQYISNSQRAANIRHAAILGTPFLGTPKAFWALLDGDCIHNVLSKINNKIKILCIPRKELIRDLTPNFPAFNQIMPSKTYFEAKGGGFYGIGLFADIAGTCSDCLNFTQTYNQQIAPTMNITLTNQAQAFHVPLDKPDQWNWNNVDVTLFVGYGQSTLVGIREVPYFNLNTLQLEKIQLPVYAPIGDGTVVRQSASLINPVTGFNHLGTAKIEYFDLDHMSLVQDSGSLCRLDYALGLPAVCTSAPQSEPDTTPVTEAQIVAFGVKKIDVVDANGNHTGPDSTIPDFVEQGIPGSAYNADQDQATVALLGGQTYTVTVTPVGDRPVNIDLMRISGSDVLTTTLYTGVNVKPDSLIRLKGDPYSVDTWQLDVDGTGNQIQPINSSVEYSKGEIPDVTAPEVSVTINGTLGPNGWYTTPVTVSVTATDNLGGSGISYIEYAFGNNREPQIYTGPFVADPALVTTVNVIAVDRAGNQSSPTTLRIGPEKINLPFVMR